MVCFTIMIVGLSFAFAWLRLRSGSVWCAVLHAAHNLFIQAFFNHLTSDTGITAYSIDEFGVSLALIAPVVASLFWQRRQSVETRHVQPTGLAAAFAAGGVPAK